MRKIKYISYFWILSITCSAQIGVNTEIPLTLFHIDATGDNTPMGVGQSGDDVVVDYDGNVGLGVTEPTTKLHVNGTLQMNDGNQKPGYILTSDNNGKASWAPNTVISQGVWDLFHSIETRPVLRAYTFTTSETQLIAGLDYIDPDNPGGGYNEIVAGDQIGLEVTGNGIIKVPAGIYMVILRMEFGGNISLTKYLRIRLKDSTSKVYSSMQLYTNEGFYSQSFGIISLLADTEMSLSVQSMATEVATFAGSTGTPFSNSYQVFLSFLQL